MVKRKPKKVYTCATVFDCELGESTLPVQLFKNITEMKKYFRECLPKCGYVELQIKEVKRVPGKSPKSSPWKFTNP